MSWISLTYTLPSPPILLFSSIPTQAITTRLSHCRSETSIECGIATTARNAMPSNEEMQQLTMPTNGMHDAPSLHAAIAASAQSNLHTEHKIATAGPRIELSQTNREHIAKLPLAFGFTIPINDDQAGHENSDHTASKQQAIDSTMSWYNRGEQLVALEVSNIRDTSHDEWNARDNHADDVDEIDDGMFSLLADNRVRCHNNTHATDVEGNNNSISGTPLSLLSTGVATKVMKDATTSKQLTEYKSAIAGPSIKFTHSNRDQIAKLPLAFGFSIPINEDDCYDENNYYSTSKQQALDATKEWYDQGERAALGPENLSDVGQDDEYHAPGNHVNDTVEIDDNICSPTKKLKLFDPTDANNHPNQPTAVGDKANNNTITSKPKKHKPLLALTKANKHPNKQTDIRDNANNGSILPSKSKRLTPTKAIMHRNKLISTEDNVTKSNTPTMVNKRSKKHTASGETTSKDNIIQSKSKKRTPIKANKHPEKHTATRDKANIENIIASKSKKLTPTKGNNHPTKKLTPTKGTKHPTKDAAAGDNANGGTIIKSKSKKLTPTKAKHSNKHTVTEDNANNDNNISSKPLAFPITEVCWDDAAAATTTNGPDNHNASKGMDLQYHPATNTDSKGENDYHDDKDRIRFEGSAILALHNGIEAYVASLFNGTKFVAARRYFGDNSSKKKRKEKQPAGKKRYAPNIKQKNRLAPSSRPVAMLVETSDCPPDLPPGWTSETYRRASGKSAGDTDTYWFTPQLKLKFRSKANIARFLDILDTEPGVNGDETAAWKVFKKRHSS